MRFLFCVVTANSVEWGIVPSESGFSHDSRDTADYTCASLVPEYTGTDNFADWLFESMT